MKTEVVNLFENIWNNYLEVTPSAKKIHQLLQAEQGNDSDIINDHVAYRTFNLAKVNLEKLAAHLTKLGYKECGNYQFDAKKLVAKHYEHEDETLPKVFISELLVEEFSDEVQTIIHKLIDQVDEASVSADNFLYSGTHWQISYQDYLTLLKESEYAAWTAAYGYRANHFTVSINHLKNFSDIEAVNDALKSGGFVLNTVGGEIKGTPEVLLEQSSTMADEVEVNFSDTSAKVPSCFYEFAKRYPMPCGNIYTGFVAANADKIFESTNVN